MVERHQNSSLVTKTQQLCAFLVLGTRRW